MIVQYSKCGLIGRTCMAPKRGVARSHWKVFKNVHKADLMSKKIINFVAFVLKFYNYFLDRPIY